MSGEARPVTPLERAVEAYLDHLVVERGVAANTLTSYRRDLNRYTAWCFARDLREPDQVTEEEVGAFLGSLRTGGPGHPPLSASSAARAVVAVRGFHRFALRESLATTDPAHQVRPPQPPRRLPKAIPVEQVEALLWAAGADQTPAALRDRALLEVLYGCGARISEAVGLDVDDLDLERGAVLLRGKGGKQ
ncbi:MAG: site-specific integrase, partial [Actinomycetes bacterium]